jgi:hypothetical protein
LTLYTGLANRRLQPLGHLSGESMRRDNTEFKLAMPVCGAVRAQTGWLLSGQNYRRYQTCLSGMCYHLSDRNAWAGNFLSGRR